MNEMAKLAGDLRLRADGRVPVVNSRDVAEMFEKRHDNVLRDIDALLVGSSDLRNLEYQGVSPFRLVLSFDDKANKEVRSFDMTKDGFALLVFGWTGARAMEFKVRYIQAFNAMAEQLAGANSDERFLAAVREIVAPLAVRFDGQDRQLERVERRVDNLAEDVAHVKDVLLRRRRHLNASTKAEHCFVSSHLGGRCPSCRIALVVDDNGAKLPFSDYDHFYQNSLPNAQHTWLICQPCHQALTTGRVPRHEREAEFRAYQNQRERLPGRQTTLFG